MIENRLLSQEHSPDDNKERSADETADFSYDGYQVVRAEFFAHLYEPSVTLNKETVSVNAACLRKLPDFEYVQFLVNPGEKKLAVKPCSEDMKDSFRWCTGDGKKRKPKKITCKIFFAKVMSLMDWDPRYRYKILGKLIRAKDDSLFVFDLSSAEAYHNRIKGEPDSTRSPHYPEEWKNQFGIPATEHQDIQQISIFDDYTVFRIERSEEIGARKDAKENVDELGEPACNNFRPEETAYPDPQ